MAEIWKNLPGWEGIYKVSDMGNIASMARVINGRKMPGRILKPLACKGGVRVNLCSGSRSESLTRTIGHLVLLAFVGGPPRDGLRARHTNGDGLDNRLSNLYWG